jgi:hypothetical protein
MKRILWLGSFTLSFLLLQPVHSQAGNYFVPVDCAHGFGKLKAKALNSMPWIHQHGPLFNYGPYQPYGVGYNWLYVPPHHLGRYVPAYPYSSYSGQYGQAPMAPAAPAMPAAPVHSPHPIVQAQPEREVLPASFEELFPIYLQNPWPSQR